MLRSEVWRKPLAKTMTSFEPFQVYWKIYGGFKGLLTSAYFWLSALMTGGCFPFWLDRGADGTGRPVADTMMALIPALMAFTLAGMAIVLALSGEKFTRAIRQGGKEDSLFMKVVVLFFHFILVQSLALFSAFILSAYPHLDWLAGTTFFLAIYGVASAVAIAAMLLNISRIYNLATDGED